MDGLAALPVTRPDHDTVTPKSFSLTQSATGIETEIVDSAIVNPKPTITLAATSIENIVLDAASGSDTIETFDMTGSPLTELAIDLGISSDMVSLRRSLTDDNGDPWLENVGEKITLTKQTDGILAGCRAKYCTTGSMPNTIQFWEDLP